MRELNEYEIQIFTHFCGTLSFFGCEYVEEIHPEDKDWHHIRLHYPNFPWKGGGYTVLIDKFGEDLDGSSIELLALGDEAGRIYELEIHRFDGKPIQRLPSVLNWLSQTP